MTIQASHHDLLLELTADAVAQARLANHQLFEIVVPMLPPQRRALAEHVNRGLSGSDLLTEPFLRDLLILVEFLDREINAGTETVWVVDEHNVHGGHHIRQRDERATALSCAADRLLDVYESVSEVLDFARSGRLVDELILD